nr:immunoglobulin light chain junction region [Macaca mulatta]
CMQGTQIPLTF